MDLDAALCDLTPRLLRYCRARTRNAGLSEEVAQDSLAALVAHWTRRGPPDSVDAFVFAIARRKISRALFRQRLGIPLDHVAEPWDRQPSPEQRAIDREERDRTLAAIARLGRRDREVLLLVGAAGLDGRRAAGVLGISESAVKVRTLRARRRLAAMLEHS